MDTAIEGGLGEGGAAVELGRFRIETERPLPELRCGANDAYAAGLAMRTTQQHFAVLCDRRSQPRLDIMRLASRLQSTRLMGLQEWGVVDWPPARRRLFAAIFEKPLGGRLAPALEQPFRAPGEDEVVRGILAPLAAALRELHAAGVVHGAVNPYTIVFRDAERLDLALGDFVTTAAGSTQPAFFAPIETALAMPMARGRGVPAEDVFALGATLAFLLLGGHPAAATDDPELLRARLEQGSYIAMIGDRRLPAGMIEPLRGMLADDPRLRWTLADVEEWLSSRRVTGRSVPAGRHALRPFEFAGGSYVTGRTLAHAFAGDAAAAAVAARSGELARWLQRSLGEEEIATRAKETLEESSATGTAGQHDAAFVARLCMALDRLAPIRYRGLAMTVDGVAGALAREVLEDGNPELVVETLQLRLPQFSLAGRLPLAPDQLMLFQLYDRLRLRLDDRQLGGGIERALYELNPSLHCLSPLVEPDYVLTMGELLAALERHAKTDFGGRSPVDRHIAAFAAAKLRTGGNEWRLALSHGDPATRLIGALRFFTLLESHSETRRSYPRIARWVAAQAAPVLDRTRHRPSRNELTALLERAAAAGRLSEMARILDNPELAERDAQGFAEAARTYAALAAEVERLASDGQRRGDLAAQLGGQLAVAAASVLAGAAAAAAIVVLG